MEILFDFSKNDYDTKKNVIDKALEIKNYKFFHIKNRENYLTQMIYILSQFFQRGEISKNDFS